MGERKLGYSGQTAPSGDSETLLSPSQRGKLISFDSSELIGWIADDDGGLHHFSVADVVGDQDLLIGQAVAFSSTGEVAREVTGLGGNGSAVRLLHGKLVSFDSQELNGWIAGDDGELYHFSAADVVGDQDLAIGQSVAFSGAGELAYEVTGLDGGGATALATLRGRLVSFDAGKLGGSIVSDEGLLYRFTAGEVVGNEDIAIGQMVRFSAAGEHAYQVCGEAPSAVAPVASPVLAPQPVQHQPAPARPQAAPTPVLTPAAARPLAPAKPLLQASETTSRPHSNTLLVAGLMAAIVVGGLAILYVQHNAESLDPVTATSTSGVTPTEIVAVPQATAPTQDEPSPAAVEVMGAAEPAPEPASGPSAESAGLPEAEPAQTETTTSPPGESSVVVAASSGATASSAPAPASIAPVVAEPAATPRPTARPKKPTTTTPVAWWLAPRPGNLNLVYAGHLADSPAIVLRFDGQFANADDAARHIEVTRSDGTRAQGKWSAGPNGRTLILRVPPGSYKVAVGAELADAAGSVLGARMSGPIQVR